MESLNLVDWFLFDEVVEGRDACQALISILLENEIHLSERPEMEKELRISPELRQAGLDVASMDVEKKNMTIQQICAFTETLFYGNEEDEYGKSEKA